MRLIKKIKRVFNVFSVIVFVLSCLVLASAIYGKPEAKAAPPEPVPASMTAESLPGGYVVRSYMGKLAVFRMGTAAPCEVFDVWVNQFPDYDINMLECGIPAMNDEELCKILEDYLS